MPRALSAEDEPLLAEHLASELQTAWPALTLLPIAPNGQVALERALAERPDIVFLDLRMPGLNGIETIRLLPNEPAAGVQDIHFVPGNPRFFMGGMAWYF